MGVGARHRQPGQLDAGVAERLGRERQRLLPHHAQPGALGVAPARAGRASRRRRSGSRRPRARCSPARRPPGRRRRCRRTRVNRVQVSITPAQRCVNRSPSSWGKVAKNCAASSAWVRRAAPVAGRSGCRSGRPRRSRPTGSGRRGSAGSSGTCSTRRRRPGGCAHPIDAQLRPARAARSSARSRRPARSSAAAAAAARGTRWCRAATRRLSDAPRGRAHHDRAGPRASSPVDLGVPSWIRTPSLQAGPAQPPGQPGRLDQRGGCPARAAPPTYVGESSSARTAAASSSSTSWPAAVDRGCQLRELLDLVGCRRHGELAGLLPVRSRCRAARWCRRCRGGCPRPAGPAWRAPRASAPRRCRSRGSGSRPRSRRCGRWPGRRRGRRRGAPRRARVTLLGAQRRPEPRVAAADHERSARVDPVSRGCGSGRRGSSSQ